MFGSDNSRRNTIAMSIGWWYLRRLIRKRGSAAVAGYVAGEGLSFARRPRRRHPLRWLVVLGLAGAGGLFWWRRQRGGGDDWGDWEPAAPIVPPPSDHEPFPTPEPDPDPVDLAPVPEPDPADLVAT